MFMTRGEFQKAVPSPLPHSQPECGDPLRGRCRETVMMSFKLSICATAHQVPPKIQRLHKGELGCRQGNRLWLGQSWGVCLFQALETVPTSSSAGSTGPPPGEPRREARQGLHLLGGWPPC